MDQTAFYQFELDYIANTYKDDLSISRFKVLFNDKLIADVQPADKQKHKISIKVKGIAGKNSIKLVDGSTYGTYGGYVDNVALYKI